MNFYTLIVGMASLFLGGGIVYLFIQYYDNIRLFFADVLWILSSVLGWFKNKSVQSVVESTCQQSINDINSLIPELQLPRVSVKWVDKDKGGNVILKEDEALVLLNYNLGKSRNVLNATSLYVKESLLKKSKPYMDVGVRKAIDFAVIRAFINKTEHSNILLPEYIDDNLEDIDKYHDAFDKISKTEGEGLFSRILLREYAIWGDKIIMEIPRDDHRKESIDFLDFVYNIATRDYEELIPLAYLSKNIKVGILLVAKYDTYYEKGIAPYVRRIKEGFSKGITTFYLLARNDKIDILNTVYGELIATGNYELQNGPQVYKDNSGRENICYCIEIKKDSDFAKIYQKIFTAIENKSVIDVVITNVFSDKLLGEYDGVDISIPVSEISLMQNIELRNYYTIGMTVKAIPIAVIEKGVVLASVISTTSNPKSMVDNKYEIGSDVVAVVEYADDDFIKLQIKDVAQEAIAFRRDLFNSRFEYLHKKFPIGTEMECVIKEIDYVSNVLILKSRSLNDPWRKVPYSVGDEMECVVYNIKDICIETELNSEYYAILPYSELAWIESDIEKKKKTIKRNQTIKVRVKSINVERHVIILTAKSQISDYRVFIKEHQNSKSQIKCVIKEISSDGYCGVVANKYDIFIPYEECHIGDVYHKCRKGEIHNVDIKGVSANGRCFAGTFKPFIHSPLALFMQQYQLGDCVSNLRIYEQYPDRIYFNIPYADKRQAKAVLYRSEISNMCSIGDMDKIFSNKVFYPLTIKVIDEERNLIVLTLKELFATNKEKISNIKYGEVVQGRIIGKNIDGYVVVVEGVLTDALFESSKKYINGTIVKMIKTSSTTFGEIDK